MKKMNNFTKSGCSESFEILIITKNRIQVVENTLNLPLQFLRIIVAFRGVIKLGNINRDRGDLIVLAILECSVLDEEFFLVLIFQQLLNYDELPPLKYHLVIRAYLNKPGERVARIHDRLQLLQGDIFLDLGKN